MVILTIPSIGVGVSVNSSDSKGVHPSLKKRVAVKYSTFVRLLEVFMLFVISDCSVINSIDEGYSSSEICSKICAASIRYTPMPLSWSTAAVSGVVRESRCTHFHAVWWRLPYRFVKLTTWTSDQSLREPPLSKPRLLHSEWLMTSWSSLRSISSSRGKGHFDAMWNWLTRLLHSELVLIDWCAFGVSHLQEEEGWNVKLFDKIAA